MHGCECVCACVCKRGQAELYVVRKIRYVHVCVREEKKKRREKEK